MAERENTISCWKYEENCCSLETNPYRRLIWRPEVSCGTEIIPALSAHDALAEAGVSLLLVPRFHLGWFESLFQSVNQHNSHSGGVAEHNRSCRHYLSASFRPVKQIASSVSSLFNMS